MTVLEILATIFVGTQVLAFIVLLYKVKNEMYKYELEKRGIEATYPGGYPMFKHDQGKLAALKLGGELRLEDELRERLRERRKPKEKEKERKDV